jgi:hypothetical protein
LLEHELDVELLDGAGARRHDRVAFAGLDRERRTSMQRFLMLVAFMAVIIAAGCQTGTPGVGADENPSQCTSLRAQSNGYC